MTEPRYLAPGLFTRHIFNRSVAGLTRMGISIAGSRILTVVGRTSGQPRSTPVNVLTYNDTRYLVSPRGHTHWVRNLRAAGNGELRVGRRTEKFTAVEVADADKTGVLRHYLKRWAWEVGAFFDGVGTKSSDADLARIAPDHPIFKISAD